MTLERSFTMTSSPIENFTVFIFALAHLSVKICTMRKFPAIRYPVGMDT